MNTQRTEAQIEASRANGALSRGAVTEEGKAKCAQTNTRHGLLSNTVLVTGESPAEFTRLLNSLIRELEPQTEGELLMVEELVVCKWRQMRIWSLTAVGLSDEIADQREKYPELLERSLPSRAYRAMDMMHRGNTTYPCLHRYETAFSRKHKLLFDKLTAQREKRLSLTQT
jgi:hypothetical protein